MLLVKVYPGMVVFVQLTCGRNVSSGGKETGRLNRNLDAAEGSLSRLVMRYASELFQHSKGCGLPHHPCLSVEALQGCGL